MLDAYIIDRIRQQKRSREFERLPLHIEVPPPPPPEVEPRRDDAEREERGIVTIDFSI